MLERGLRFPRERVIRNRGNRSIGIVVSIERRCQGAKHETWNPQVGDLVPHRTRRVRYDSVCIERITHTEGCHDRSTALGAAATDHITANRDPHVPRLSESSRRSAKQEPNND